MANLGSQAWARVSLTRSRGTKNQDSQKSFQTTSWFPHLGLAFLFRFIHFLTADYRWTQNFRPIWGGRAAEGIAPRKGVEATNTQVAAPEEYICRKVAPLRTERRAFCSRGRVRLQNGPRKGTWKTRSDSEVCQCFEAPKAAEAVAEGLRGRGIRVLGIGSKFFCSGWADWLLFAVLVEASAGCWRPAAEACCLHLGYPWLNSFRNNPTGLATRIRMHRPRMPGRRPSCTFWKPKPGMTARFRCLCATARGSPPARAR